MQSARVGKRGAIIVPAKLRKRFGIEEGSIVIAVVKDDGILIRPAMIVARTIYARTQIGIPIVQRDRRRRLSQGMKRGLEIRTRS